MMWERRADRTSYLGMMFVAGWIACQMYYNLAGLWTQRNALQKEVATVENTCQDLRRIAILHMIEQQDEGLTPDWSQIKPCPKTLPTAAK